MRVVALLSLLAHAVALRLPAGTAGQRKLDRRDAMHLAAVAVASVGTALPASAAQPAKILRDGAAEMRAFVEQKDAFIAGLENADPSAPQLPKSISLSTFQALEKDADPEYMEVVIDYAEAMRNARDLVRLAKLTKEKVTISVKEKGKPRQVSQELEYGAAEGSGLAPTKEYAERAFQEVVGASVVLDAAVNFLPKGK